MSEFPGGEGCSGVTGKAQSQRDPHPGGDHRLTDPQTPRPPPPWTPALPQHIRTQSLTHHVHTCHPLTQQNDTKRDSPPVWGAQPTQSSCIHPALTALSQAPPHPRAAPLSGDYAEGAPTLPPCLALSSLSPLSSDPIGSMAPHPTGHPLTHQIGVLAVRPRHHLPANTALGCTVQRKGGSREVSQTNGQDTSCLALGPSRLPISHLPRSLGRC